MTKNRIVKYAANTALLAVLAAAGIGVYQIGTYTPDKEIQEELQTDQSEDTPMVDADTSLVDAEISDTTGQNDTAEEKITQTLTDSADSSEKTSDSVSANEAITESRRIMDGNKWRLFCLDFSFIGWELLCSVPLYAEGFLVLKYFTGSEALAISLVLLLTIPLSIGFFFVRPYEEAAWATFYRDITAAPTEPDEAY